MKFQAVLVTTMWWLPNFVGLAQAQTSTCSSATNNGACGKISGCNWKNNACVEVVHTDVHVPCSSRSTSDCEQDDTCMKLKGSCIEVNLGVGKEGTPCQVTLSLDSDGTPFYPEVTNKGCAEGFICSVENSTSGLEGEVIDGTCAPTTCIGKKVPGNCNGNSARTADTKDQCDAMTQRVTICHRTCSRKNPWVRITIDEDAWSGEGCGHSLQHDVRDECKNKFPWTEWGVNRKDYLIKFHGTRNQTYYREGFKNTNEEKAYWRIWEPACPYVRNGHCCQWNSTTNPCCGDPPSTKTPTITHKKYVGPPGSCNANGVKTLQDDTYSGKTGSDYAYCYETKVPADAQECLYAVTMKDPAPVGGTKKDVNVTGAFELLCPGQVKYVSGPTVQVPVGGEASYDSTVTGVGAESGKTVTASDPAKVTEIPTNVVPKIDVTKYAGPQGKCSVDGVSSMEDVRYTLPTDSSPWQYCYVISIPPDATDCVKGVMLEDDAPLGGKTINVADELCANDKLYFDGNLVTGLTATEGPYPARVSGTGVNSDSKVSDSDDATVAPPPVIEIKKYAGPADQCAKQAIMDELIKDVEYIPFTKGSTWAYCYVITIPETAPECLKAVTMKDPAPLGGTGGAITVNNGEDLCPGSVTYVEGKSVEGLTASEGPINATVTGTGVDSGVTVSDDDDAKVTPPDIDIIPVVQITKYAGPSSKCSKEGISGMSDGLYTLPSRSSPWQYCYKITATGSTDCLIDVTMVDPAPHGLSTAVTGAGEQLCAGDVKYIPGDIVAGLNATEGPDDATVTGKGALTKEEVSDIDDAEVSPPPKPVIEIKKYAGPVGACSAADIMDNTMVDDTYTLTAPSGSWQYCYVVSVPSNSTECLLAVTMKDSAAHGLSTYVITEGQDALCPSDVRYITGPPVVGLNVDKEGPDDAIVTGTGKTSEMEVSAKDSAAVQPLGARCAPLPTPECPEDIELMTTPDTEFPFNPITVISQNTETVTVTISNPFDDDVTALYYQFAGAETGTSRCDSVSPFKYCNEPITVTAHCLKGRTHSIAVVDVWFVDSTVVDSSDKDVVPQCCQPNPQDAGVATVVYSFKVYCDTTCPAAPGRRALRESTDDLSALPKPEGKLDNNAELCSLEHFACGDNGKSVNVCHYSAKDGYQTYCVPQADSDVVAYFPKDYCGPCVGGYANVEASM